MFSDKGLWIKYWVKDVLNKEVETKSIRVEGVVIQLTFYQNN